MADKDFSIRYKFTGDATGIQKVARSMAAETKKMSSSFNKLNQTIKGVGASLLAVFAVDRIANFTKESMKLAASAEGIKAAFQALNKPGLLNELQEATRGTVDNVTLMQKAVQAHNFKIPLDQLATFFEFATKRAIQTGESVDYLVNSLITGLGRKSVLVMDNLGISAVELQKEVAKVGDFGLAAGNIIRSELGSMGDVASTAATRFSTFSASVTNLKTAWGEFLNNSELIKKSIEGVASALQNIADRGLLGAMFESKGKAAARAKEKAFWDVDWNGLPMKIEAVVPPLTDIDEVSKSTGKSIAEYVAQIKAGAVEAEKMAEAWKIIHAEILGSKGGVEKLNVPVPGVGGVMPALPGLAGPPDLVDAATKAALFNEQLQKELTIVGALDSAFVGFFQNMGSGIDNMAKSFIAALNQITAQLAARAAIFGILSIFAGKSAIVEKGFGEFMKGVFGLASGGIVSGPTLANVGEYAGAKSNPEVVAPLSKLKGMMGAQTMKVIVEGKMRGKDIYFTTMRYAEVLNKST